MTKLKLFLVLAVICYVTANVRAQYPRDSAVNRVLNHILINDIGHVNIYASLDSKSGNTGLPLLYDEPIVFPFGSNWVFFIDDHPYAGWNHNCRYIFIDTTNGTDTVISDRSIYPLGLSQDFELISRVTPFSPCDPIYPQPSPVTVTGLPPNPHLFAVIIAGIEDDTAVRPTQSWNDISAVYTTLEKVYGYNKENMFVHYFTGHSPARGSDLDGGMISKDIDYAAYKDTIHHTFRCLAGEETDPLIPKLQFEDQLFVYVDDHGDASSTHSWIILPPDPNIPPNPFTNIYDTALANWVRNIQCGQMIFLIEPCYSGGFVNDLQTNDSVKCKNRSIYTSAAYNEKEYMDYHISDTTYGEFIFYWTAAARGYFPDINGNQPWATGFPVYDTVSFPLFPYKACFDSCAQSHPYYNPDSNHDGSVTMEEAFAYANDFDSWSGGPGSGFFCPLEPLVNTHPQNYKNISFQEDLQSLNGLCGNITHTQTVENRSYVVGGPIAINGNATLSFNSAGQDTAKVYFINNLADLTVNVGSQLNTGSGMIFGGMEQNEIKIQGSINLINYITFKAIQPGTYFSGLHLNNHNTEVTLSHVHFNNTGLLNNGLHLRINNGSTFLNCGQLISNYGNVNISNSVFSETSLYLNNLLQNSTFIDSIYNNSITASNNHDAVNISNYNNFSIQNNTISGAGINYSGLGLFYSGLGTSSNFNVVNNNISNCQTGITGYNSNAFIHDNHIYNNIIGIKSVNFSNLQLIGEKFMNAGDITQAIYNNTSYEIYSYFDFPFVRYNKIFDDNDPTNCLIYVEACDPEPDLPFTQITFDVRYNCWKNNSIPSQLCSRYGNNATFIYEPYFCFSYPISDTIGDPREDMYKTGDSLFNVGNFIGAKDLYISLIEQYPKSEYSQAAMKVLFGVEQFATNDYPGLNHPRLKGEGIIKTVI